MKGPTSLHPSRFFEHAGNNFSVVSDPSRRELRTNESIFETQRSAVLHLSQRGQKEIGENLAKGKGLKPKLVCHSFCFHSLCIECLVEHQKFFERCFETSTRLASPIGNGVFYGTCSCFRDYYFDYLEDPLIHRPQVG